MINFMTNTKFYKMLTKQIYQLIKYYKGFTKDKTIDKNEDIFDSVQEATAALLQQLPDNPDDIPDNITQKLPFTLSVKQREHTKAIVAALHRVYKFDKLPDAYFTALEPLPNKPENLNPEVKHLFPITDRGQLRDLTYLTRKLRNYYIFNRIPTSYFDLPPPKKALPAAYQDLEHKYRVHFPIDPQNPETNFTAIMQLLREDYYFQSLPNDYIVAKPYLPKDPSKINTGIVTYEYPITDKEQAKRFVALMSQRYKFSLPLPPNIMTANPTEKPELPEDPKQIT